MTLKELIEISDDKKTIHLILENTETKKIIDVKVSQKYLIRNKKYFNNCNLNVIYCKKI